MQRTHGSQAPRDATGWHGQPFARMENVSRIAVLRPNAVGDFVFALPALHALKHAYPDAELVYVGKEWYAQFLHGRPGPVDRVLVMPPVPGVGAPARWGQGRNRKPEASRPNASWRGCAMSASTSLCRCSAAAVSPIRSSKLMQI